MSATVVDNLSPCSHTLKASFSRLEVSKSSKRIEIVAAGEEGMLSPAGMMRIPYIRDSLSTHYILPIS